ncbi:MAG: ribosome maturation factor RimM [Chloroflexi bacterium]|nr:ribosome maturation factor RimM [Chloroflexota bacterium]MDA1227367.1 ribosome maturation factor RimM [Chloroflexota bacterium]
MPSRDVKPQANPTPGHVVVGHIRGGWGIKGEIKVELLSDAPTRFADNSVVHLKGKPVKVEHSRRSKGILLVKLASVRDRTTADSLRGQLLTVPEADAEPLPNGAYYYFQIMEMPVQTADGEKLGRIVEIIETGANDVYVVRLEGRRDILVPALEDVILSVDLEGDGMTVQLPEGLV